MPRILIIVGAIKRPTGWTGRFLGVGPVAAVEERSRTGETASEGEEGGRGGLAAFLGLAICLK